MRLFSWLLIVVIVLACGLVAADRFAPEATARASVKVQRAIAGLTEKRAQIEGFEMPYLEGGSGEPLVLVHGIGADKDNFDQAAIWLTRHYRVISIDLPGFGEASKPEDADYGIAAQAARLDRFMQAIGLARAHFGGSSMGGWIIGTYAAAHPEKVQSLWMLGAAGTRGAQESVVMRAWRTEQKLMLFAKDREDFERILDTVFTTRPFIPPSVRHVLAQAAARNYALHGRIFADLVRDFDQTALEDRLAGLQVPALIVFGDGDRAVHPSAGEVLKAALPNSQLILMQGIGHLPMLEAPRRTAHDYIAFRSRL